MDFFELVQRRRSIRKFQPRSIPAEMMDKILEAIRWAPSAGNLQAYEVFVVEDRERLHQLAEAALGQEFIEEAPVALVFCANPAQSGARYGSRGQRLYALQDATIACAHAHLAAAALGLGSVWVGAFHDEAVWQAIGAPEGLKPVAILPLGFPAENPPPTPRRSLPEFIHHLR
ncbi:MAG: nitroreductase family protein [Thermogutta sp.]|uniref:nitroreductase family protein n=1 Tax=Thermogutta sp. TaxID=1962930 RepID=UPI0019A5CB2C|nr:nitroreductase family protein [Thermogutta sp.]MBC7350749.1 nitroreductase family protein [Thermogutta sp.]